MENKAKGNILVIDDDPDVLKAANLLLKRHYKSVVSNQNPDNLAQLLTHQDWDVILLDMNFEPGANTGQEGLKWLSIIKQRQPSALVILMTAYGAVDTAVQAIKQGAFDFILKPWQNERLLTTVNTAMQLRESKEEVQHLKSRQQELTIDNSGSSMVGDSLPFRALRNIIQRVAPTDATVLILGDNGTGKEIVAREIYLQSARRNNILVSVDLGSVSESLFESELFGHKKGSFTGATSDRIGRFQAAEGGTLFLDEIGNLPLHLQGKLLTVLEQREVIPVGANTPVKIDVRLICATNQPLMQMISQGTFREDLLYRINTVEISVPPLRERPEDIAVLLNYFIDIYCRKYQIKKPSVSDKTIQQLQTYHWPGNIRELRHAVERALILNTGGQLEAKELLLQSSTDIHRKTERENNKIDSMITDLNLDNIEKQVIEKALKKHQGNISHSAKKLGITRTSLYRRMEKYDL